MAVSSFVVSYTRRRGGERHDAAARLLRLIGFEPPTFDIHKFVYGIKYAPSDFTLVPDIAQKADVSRDGRVYTIALRRGIRWEKKAPLNGRELVAAEALETPDRHTVRLDEPKSPLSESPRPRAPWPAGAG